MEPMAYGVVQYTSRGRLTDKVFGPFTEQAAIDFVESAQVSGYIYIRVAVQGPFSKQEVLDAARLLAE